MEPPVCTLSPDWWLAALASVVGLVVGVAAPLLWRRALDQDDFPDADPHARPFADSEGGPR